MYPLDRPLFDLVFSLAHRSAFLDTLAIILAVYAPYFLVAGFLYLLWREKSVRQKAFWFAEAAIATIFSRGILTEAIRFFWNRPRPFAVLEVSALITHDAGGAFPSGHMAFYAALAAVIWAFNRKWGWWYAALTALVGLSRIIVGVHWPLDIIGGIVLGVLSALFVVRALKPYGAEFFVLDRVAKNLS